MRNLRSTRNYAAGKPKPRGPRKESLGLWLAGLFLLWGAKGLALADRKAWVFEQIGRYPHPTERQESRHQVSLDIVNYSDSLSTQASVLIDVHLFEIYGKASQRSFLASTEKGTLVKNQLDSEQQTLSGEIARNFITKQNHFGRLGIEFLQFFPDSERKWIRLGILAGATASSEIPWTLQFKAGFFFPIHHDDKILLVGGESTRVFSLTKKITFELGGFLSWHYKLRGDVGPGNYDHMLLSFGPLAQIHTPVGQLRTTFLWRLWLDKEMFLRGTELKTAYPNELLGLPDVSLGWTVTF